MANPYMVGDKVITGSNVLAVHLNKVKQEVRHFYQSVVGEANLLAQASGIPHNVSKKKPDVIVIYEQVDRFGNYWSGGIANQPYILMRELKIVQDELALSKKINDP